MGVAGDGQDFDNRLRLRRVPILGDDEFEVDLFEVAQRA
jgi:hypothetical protein